MMAPQDFSALFEESVQQKVREFGEHDPRTLDRIRDLAAHLIRNKRYADAETWLRRISNPRAGDLESLADVLNALQRPRDAAEAYERSGNASSIAKLAAMFEGEQSLALYRKALALEEKASGPDSAKTAVRLNDVALITRDEAMFRRALAIQTKAYGPRHPEVATTLNNLASLLLEKNRAPEAEPLARRALSILEATLGKRNPRTGVAASNLADTLAALGRRTEALALYRQAHAIFLEALGPDHPWTQDALAATRAK